MSRTILLKTKYKNGKTIQVGLYNPKNADMVKCMFSYIHYCNLVERLKYVIKKRKIKNNITISISQSYSLSSLGNFSCSIVVPLQLLNKKIIYDRINHILNFKPEVKK